MVEALRPGAFSGQLDLFVADPYTRQIAIVVHGEAKEIKTEVK